VVNRIDRFTLPGDDHREPIRFAATRFETWTFSVSLAAAMLTTFGEA